MYTHVSILYIFEILLIFQIFRERAINPGYNFFYHSCSYFNVVVFLLYHLHQQQLAVCVFICLVIQWACLRLERVSIFLLAFCVETGLVRKYLHRTHKIFKRNVSLYSFVIFWVLKIKKKIVEKEQHPIYWADRKTHKHKHPDTI